MSSSSLLSGGPWSGIWWRSLTELVSLTAGSLATTLATLATSLTRSLAATVLAPPPTRKGPKFTTTGV